MHEKGHNDVLTLTDTTSEKMIMNKILQYFLVSIGYLEDGKPHGGAV